MHRDAVERLLPTMFQLAARPGSPLDALLHVMADMHEPDEQLLDEFHAVLDPYRAPDQFVPWLTTWVGIEWLVADQGAEPVPADMLTEVGPPTGRLRNCVAAAHALAQWRGTEVAMTLLLTTATGVTGFTVEEPPGRPFHIIVSAPPEAEPRRALVVRIIEAMKPAACTAELRIEPGEPEPTPPGDDPPREEQQ